MKGWNKHKNHKGEPIFKETRHTYTSRFPGLNGNSRQRRKQRREKVTHGT